MAVGERIRYFRKLRNMTMKWLGMELGFPENTADIRIAQYEKGTRTPKDFLITVMAKIFDVSPRALDVPDIDSKDGLMHTLFTLEDTHGITIGKFEGRTCLYLNRNAPDWLRTALNSWEREAQKFHNDEITKEEYDHWRYHFPETAEDVMDTREPQALNPRLIDKLGLRELLEDESTGIDLEAIMRYREKRKARKKHDDGKA